MKSVDSFEETFNTLKAEIAKIDEAYDNLSLGRVEGKAVRALQLMEAQIGDIGGELYATVKQRRAGIAQGRIVEPEAKPTKKGRKK